MAITLLGTVTVTGATSGTSGTLITTGATLLVAHASYLSSAPLTTISDSKGNTWTALTASDSGVSGACRLFYSLNPAVGSGHTFSFSGSNSVCLIVAAFSGVYLFGTQGAGNVGGSSASGSAPGPITTTDFDQLVVTGFAWNDNSSAATINLSFTVTNSINLVGGNNFGGAFGYRVIAIPGAYQPQWDNGTFGRRESTIANFLPAPPAIPDFAPHDLTSETSHSPFVVSSSSQFSGALARWMAFDGQFGSGHYWIGTGGGVDWLALDTGSTTYILDSYSIVANTIPEAARMPKNWTMEGSTDGGVTWAVIDTVTNQTAWGNGERRNFVCDVTAAFSRFRVNITANNGDATYTQIAELYLYGLPGIGPYEGFTLSDSARYALSAQNQKIVQTAEVTSGSNPTVAIMPQNVTAGNLLVLMVGNIGGNDASAVITDTRSLTFTLRANVINVSGGQSTSYVYTAPITSSGPETVTRTIASSNYPVSMWLLEISGFPNFTVEATSGGTADGGNSVSGGSLGSIKGGDIPIMTGPSAPSGTASASETYPTTPAWNAFAPSTNGWITNASALPQWLQYQFGSAITIIGYGIVPWSVDNFPTRSPNTWVFQGSNNGSTWTTLDTQTAYTSWIQSCPSIFPIAGAAAYSYYRLTVSVNGGNAYTGVAGLQVFTAYTKTFLVVAASSDNTANLYTSALPIGSTTAFLSSVGGFLAKFMLAGTSTIVFNKTVAGLRWSAASALIAAPLLPVGPTDSISLSDTLAVTITSIAASTILVSDTLGLVDLLVASFTFPPPPEFGPLHEFEFYGMNTPEDVEILPVPKKYDQVGPVRFDKIGKIFGFRIRLIASGITMSMPYKIYGDDSESLDHLNSPLFFDSFTVRPGLDNVYEIQLPKSVNTDICRITFGPVDDPFYRYDVLIKVHISGMKGQAKWIPIR